MTDGARTGTSGRRTLPPWAVAYAIIMVSTLILNTVNVLSFLDERSWQNRPLWLCAALLTMRSPLN